MGVKRKTLFFCNILVVFKSPFSKGVLEGIMEGSHVRDLQGKNSVRNYGVSVGP